MSRSSCTMSVPFNLGDLISPGRDQGKMGLIDLGGEVTPREYSYADIQRNCNAVARGLVRSGFHAGQRIGILSANRAEFLFCHYGIMRAGLVSVPINFKFPAALIEFVIQDADIDLVFCDAAREKDVPAGVRKVVFNADGSGGFEAFLDHGDFDVVRPTEQQPAMFLYTSGSTGKPKGVVLSHESHIWVSKTRLGGNDLSHHRFLIAAPLYHMNALSLSMLSTIAHATIVMLPQFNARSYLNAIQTYRCTWLTAVPPMVAMMLQEKDLVEQTDFSSVEFLRMGSAPVSGSLAESIASVLPNVKITNAYGTTEGGPVVFGPHPKGIPQPVLSVGYPHRDVTLRLVNDVLEIKSPGLMLGYHKADSRVPPLASPFTEDGFYITGDMFRVDQDGFYFFIGRSDDMFVSGGENIYPTEVERLLESHPAVDQAAVVPIDDDIKGQKPVAFVVRKPNAQISEEALKQHCLRNAPAYQHPRCIWFVENLPLASTNKIDKSELKSRARRFVEDGLV
jgi:long-chain acyl-CoA synthetase